MHSVSLLEAPLTAYHQALRNMITGQSMVGRRHSIAVPTPSEMRAFVQSISSPEFDFNPSPDPWDFDCQPVKRRRRYVTPPCYRNRKFTGWPLYSVCEDGEPFTQEIEIAYPVLRRGSTPTIPQGPPVYTPNGPPHYPPFPTEYLSNRTRPVRRKMPPRFQEYSRQVDHYEQTYSHLPQLDAREIYPAIGSLGASVPTPSADNARTLTPPMDNVNSSPECFSSEPIDFTNNVDLDEFLDSVCELGDFGECEMSHPPPMDLPPQEPQMANFPLATSDWGIPTQAVKVKPSRRKGERKLKWSNVTEAVTSKYQRPL